MNLLLVLLPASYAFSHLTFVRFRIRCLLLLVTAEVIPFKTYWCWYFDFGCLVFVAVLTLLHHFLIILPEIAVAYIQSNISFFVVERLRVSPSAWEVSLTEMMLGIIPHPFRWGLRPRAVRFQLRSPGPTKVTTSGRFWTRKYLSWCFKMVIESDQPMRVWAKNQYIYLGRGESFKSSAVVVKQCLWGPPTFNAICLCSGVLRSAKPQRAWELSYSR